MRGLWRFVTTATSPSHSCQAGYEPLTFSIFIDFSSTNLARVTFTVTPDGDEDGEPLAKAAEIGYLLEGEEVHRVGKVWQLTNGLALPDSYLSNSKGEPPLAPRVQFSSKRQPVAGYVQQIKE